MDRKKTAWKKSRTFGDIYGGRTRRRLSDNIFARAHSLSRPGQNDDLPILIQENPSRECFFPLSANEVKKALKALPKEDYEGITHIWLRRIKKSEYQKGTSVLAEFVCGSGVRAIVLYPWRKDLIQVFGKTKPSQRAINEYHRFCPNELKKVNGQWVLKWTLSSLKQYNIHILYHEVGHHIDWYFRQWSKANHKQVEEFADHYAFQKEAIRNNIYNFLNKHES